MAVVVAAILHLNQAADFEHGRAAELAADDDQQHPLLFARGKQGMAQVAGGWIKYFDASPAFFMAVNGQMAFTNTVAAQEGTRKFAQTIRHIELKWGDDLRVDPLTNEFAVVAVSWREIQVDTAGHSVTETGYFTGLAEYRERHWQFRDAHWSSPVSSH